MPTSVLAAVDEPRTVATPLSVLVPALAPVTTTAPVVVLMPTVCAEASNVSVPPPPMMESVPAE